MSNFNEKQKQNTLNFLSELKILQLLKEKYSSEEDENLETENSSEIREKLADAVKPFDPFPRSGEIRLLAQPEKLTYAALLHWDWCHSIVIPLSHYENSATDKEMLAENGKEKGLFRQVYQFWNMRTLHNTLLAESWIVDKISPEEIAKLKKMMQYSLLGDALPEEIRNLTGTPIFREEDPRIGYMQEENDLFKELDAMDLALENSMEEIRENSFDEEKKPLLFPAPDMILQAAAGENELSGVYKMDESDQFQFITAVECEDFAYVSKGETIPHFTWFTKTDIPAKTRTVFFRHSVSGELIGSGLIFKEKDGIVIRLMSSISDEEDGCDVPEISTPAEIEIILI